MNCDICKKWVEHNILDHVRLFHPEVDAAEVERWPDGDPVIYEGL